MTSAKSSTMFFPWELVSWRQLMESKTLKSFKTLASKSWPKTTGSTSGSTQLTLFPPSLRKKSVIFTGDSLILFVQNRELPSLSMSHSATWPLSISSWMLTCKRTWRTASTPRWFAHPRFGCLITWTHTQHSEIGKKHRKLMSWAKSAMPWEMLARTKMTAMAAPSQSPEFTWATKHTLTSCSQATSARQVRPCLITYIRWTCN